MKIYASFDDDISEGFVWIKKPGLPARCLVKIRTSEGRHSVVCEALQLEDNFLHRYNQPPRLTIDDPESSIVMSGWYRARLGGLETQKEYALKITSTRCWWGRIRACMDHPQIVVRVAVWLGVLSITLGVVGVLLGIIGVWPKS